MNFEPHPNANVYLKNLLILSFSFLLVYSAFAALQNLESSLSIASCQQCSAGTSGACHHNLNNTCMGKVRFTCDSKCIDGYTECTSSIGSSSIGVIYLVFTFSCICGSAFERRFGPKTCFLTGFTAIALFCIANIVASKYTDDQDIVRDVLLSASVLVGVSAAFVWTAQGCYVTRSATAYAFCKNLSSCEVMGLFNGIFFGIYQFSQVLGNLAASLLLSEAELSLTTLFVFYLFLTLAGILLITFLQPLDSTCTRHIEDDFTQEFPTEKSALINEPKARNEHISSMLEVLALCADRRIVVIVPLSIITGMEQAFAWGDFTSQYVKPSLGEAAIGYAMTAFGMMNVIGSFTIGKLSDRLGRWLTLAICSAVLGSAYVLLAMAEVSFCDSQWHLLLIVACILGFGDASFTTIGMAILGDIFNDNPDPAFANFQMWKSATISFLLLMNESISPESKLTAMLGFISISIIAFQLYHLRRFLL